MENIRKVVISGINIYDINYDELSGIIKSSISKGTRLKIGYANADTINRSYNTPEIIKKLNSFDIIHPDGVGVFLASKFLFGKKCFRQRFTGSDFYPILADLALKNGFKIFFFGGRTETLSRIKQNFPISMIAGIHEGYNFEDEVVIQKINSSGADILLAGLGREKQENWILLNEHKLDCKVIIAVGEGIKVFAGEKTRGPIFLQKTGMEWLARFLSNPLKYFGRYIVGNPLFLYRIIKLKMRNLG